MSALDRKTRKNDAMESIRIVEEILRRWDPIGVQPAEYTLNEHLCRFAPVPPNISLERTRER